jgi:hypothetical protein
LLIAVKVGRRTITRLARAIVKANPKLKLRSINTTITHGRR